MSNSIGIRITGSVDEVIYLSDFIQAGNDLMELLNEVDTSLSPNYRSTTNWKLKKLSYSSPATLEVESQVKEEQPDNGAEIIDTTLNGFLILNCSSTRPRGFSDKALEKARDLAKIATDGIGKLEITSDSFAVEFTPRIMENVNVIMKPGREIYGTIEGHLESINAHEEFRFFIFDPILSRRIRCTLLDEKDKVLRQKVLQSFEQNILVSGRLLTNLSGEVSSAKINNLEVKETAPLNKDASEFTGIWDFTKGVDPVEYIRGIRNER